MTIKVIEKDGKFFAYHAHIVYHGDPDSVDFDPNDNSTVEVMAELPHSSHLAAMRSPEQLGLDRELKPREKMVDVVCPDPKCGSVTTYPAAGDPEARALHARYAQDVTGKDHTARLALDLNNPEHVAPLHAAITPFVANAWARKQLDLDPVAGHGHLHAMYDPQTRELVPPKG